MFYESRTELKENNIEKYRKRDNSFRYIKEMKAKEILEKYKITRRTLFNWVKTGKIRVEKTPSGRYLYFEKINEKL